MHKILNFFYKLGIINTILFFILYVAYEWLDKPDRSLDMLIGACVMLVCSGACRYMIKVSPNYKKISAPSGAHDK